MIHHQRSFFSAIIFVTSKRINLFMDQRIISLYDEYTHKPLSRKEFLNRLTLLTGSSAAAMAVLPLLEANYLNAAVTDQEDLFTEHITYPGSKTEMQAYV